MPVRLITVSSATGTFGPIDYGNAYRYAAYAGASSANKDYAGTVQGSLGNSGIWTTVLTLTTTNSTGQVSSTGTDLVLFDKLRMVVTKNNTTADSPVWLAASD